MGANLNFTDPSVGAAGPGWAAAINTALANIDAAALVSVRAYGAVGDGVADDTAAFAAASTAAGPTGSLWVAAGTYKVSALPTIATAARSIICAGSGQVTFLHTGAAACLLVQPSSPTTAQAGRLLGCTIDGTSAASASAVGVHLVDTTGFGFDDVVVVNYAGASAVGIELECSAGTCRGIAGGRVSLTNNTVGLQLVGGSATGFAGHTWTGLRLSVGAGQIGVQAAGSASVVDGHWNVRCDITGTAGIGFDLAGTSRWSGWLVASVTQSAGTGGIGRRVASTASWTAAGVYTSVLAEVGGTVSPVEVRNGGLAFGNIRVRGEMGVNPMHPDFGAVGDGVADDIVALERARDFCLTGSLAVAPTDPATTIRTPLYPLVITKMHKVSRPFKLYSLANFKMVGNGRNTGFLGTAGQTNVLDINGVTWSRFADFLASGPTGSGSVDAVIDYYWDNRTAARSTSGSTFENIQIEGRFVHGFGVSRLGFLISGGAPQVDQTKFDQVLVTGGSQSDATLWQSAYRLGNGVAGNQTNYWFIGGGVALCRYGYHGSGVKDVVILGGAAALLDTLVYNNGLWDLTCLGMELEDVQRLYDAVGVSSSPNRITFENIEHAFVTVPSDGKFVKHYQGGTFTLRGYRQANFPGGTQPALGMTFFQIAPNEINVILDGVQMFEPLDAVMNWSGPIRALVTGYSRLSKSTFAVTDNIAGPLYITPNPTDVAHRVRQTADTVDRWNVNAAGDLGWGPGGSTAQDTTLSRVTGGGLALGGGGLRLNGHSTLHSVTGLPSSGLGANGDLAVRDDGTAGAALYQKRAGAWVAIA